LRRAVAAFAAAAVAALLSPSPGRPHVDGPPPAHTGGFGEPTCGVCHAGELAGRGGELVLVVPPRFAPGGEHPIEVRLARPGMRRAGFQLSARFASGPLAGQQAGRLSPAAGPGERAVALVAAHEVSYAGHTAASVKAIEGDEARWRIRWRAPADVAASTPVIFHVAANAANYDDSELGDHVYVASALSRPASSGGR
jgi:hypothetical protein